MDELFIMSDNSSYAVLNVQAPSNGQAMSMLDKSSIAYGYLPKLGYHLWQNVVLLLLGCFALYGVFLVVYRVYLSPLAAFPGPFPAKITHWYEFYHNWVRCGMYWEEICKMHERYGPVVRVTPEEIHIMDSTAYQKLFVNGSVRKTDAYRRFSNGTGFEDMTAISTTHDYHRRLRAPLDRIFARSSIMRLETRVVERTDRMMSRLNVYKGTNEPVNLTNALSSLTTDIISSIIFEEPSDYLGSPDFNDRWYHTLKMGTKSVPLFKHMPGMVSAVATPLLRRFISWITDWTIWDEKARRQVMLVRKRPADSSRTRDETTVLDHLVHSELVEKELGNGGFARLAQLVQQAGAHNVSHTLGTIMTHLLLEPDKMTPVQDELRTAWVATKLGDANIGQSTSVANEDVKSRRVACPSWIELEKLPYLSAVVAEGLRMAIGGMNRTPRVFPNDDIELCGWTIPKGTPISMSTYWMHTDPVVFPNPHNFEPRRWLEATPEQLKLMKQYFVPFATGSRACVGQNLVYMQMYHTLARLLGPDAPDFSLYETTLQDIVAIHGLLFPMPPFDSKGVRVLIQANESEDNHKQSVCAIDEAYSEADV